MPRLYIVATPVGNLEDITFRAARILKEAAAVACEDTRVTRKLLTKYGIKTRLISCHEHNEARAAARIVGILKDGGDVALVTDAGTPLLSDPGHRVVARAAENGFEVSPVPGASALLCALAVCGLPFSGFTFLGFLPRGRARALRALEEAASSPRPFVVYESPKRAASALKLIIEAAGDRPAALCREMTKIYEEVLRGRLSELSDGLAGRETLKGEVVIVVGGPEEGRASLEKDEIKARLAALKEGGAGFREAVAGVSGSASKNAVYNLALEVWGRGARKD
ncbi:MAG: 16S rRNA (cytidine(1402)-2'-O)-methyltransferase [Candidatus Dadabacteria bacterium]|nr:16S rRNA (cytidine(1402)-2'-O)-methyltransferase [Candidatus Dadabacteria bacterium]